MSRAVEIWMATFKGQALVTRYSMKTPSGVSLRGPIAKRVIADLKKQSKRKVVDLSQLRRAKLEGNNLLGSTISQEDLGQYDTLHGVYVYAQNLLSVFVLRVSKVLMKCDELAQCGKSRSLGKEDL
jgi:hypothetical protein